EGELILELSKGRDRFCARFELSSGTCTLQRNNTTLPPEKQTRMNKPGTYLVRFANVDRRLTVWVDKTLPFEDGVSYGPPDDTAFDRANALEPASIGVRGPASLSVQHLQLGRDTYYTLYPEEGLSEDGWSAPDAWSEFLKTISNKSNKVEG